ncbi:MAG: endonuclease III [Nanoarchaeota archaeon]|nr:endonuclease III [Nanoarchaeota archaeon]
MGRVNRTFPIENVLDTLEGEYQKWDVPVVTLIAMQSGDPFKVLISTIISLRTKDEVTIEASKRIYKLLTKPSDVYGVTIEQIEQAIYPCGFYKRKAIQIMDICDRLVKEFNSEVPDTIDILLDFPGIGRKTANLIVAEGHNLPALCVDVHVHRICNRLGYILTKDPDDTEFTLRRSLDQDYWKKINYLMVAFGQSLCRPVSPHCSKCPLLDVCKRKGVDKHR